MEDSQLVVSLRRAAELKRMIEPLEEQMKPLVDELGSLRIIIEAYMKQTGMMSSAEVDGYYATRSESKSLVVENQSMVTLWLENKGLLEDYLKIDITGLKKLAKQIMKEDGEIIPGTRMDVTHVMSIKKKD